MVEISEEERDFVERVQGYKRKRPYKPIFGRPESDWKVEANWEDAYYGAAFVIISGVVEGRYPKGVEGVAGLYLFRHYLELSLKYIILHARRLKAATNAKPEEVQAVEKRHFLKQFWESAKAEAAPKIEKNFWQELDIEFIDAFVAEWDEIDPHPATRFRYQGKSFGGPAPAAEHELLWIDFSRLLESMPHVREVLGMIDVYLCQTYGMNEEWEAEMGSW